ncbi:glucagon-like peptide 2 receptor [Megalops cyprinoides]|uniref:glucagon-like peptide 2 receptor n=1 Tax=Megalops cyprinoides TaxID=118141 RepID=UPI001864F4BE|nr:glucagon-like peptide 2 receptor [Megalops cyprinoides]
MPTSLSAWQRGWLTLGSTTLPAFLLLLSSFQVMGSILEDVIYKRAEYQENCTRTLASTSFSRTGVYCNGTFDLFACWPHSPPGNVSVSCPVYLPWIKEGESKYVYRVCTPSGAWRTMENSTDVWRDQSECVNPQYFKPQEEDVLLHSVLRIISIIGYSLSLFSLLLAVLILGLLRKLHCTRNYIHMNLFVSFMLRAMAIMIKEVILQVMYSNLPTDETGWNEYTNSAISVLCKATQVSMHYFVGGNYFWLLVEGIFLHTLLFTAVLTKRRLLKKYMLIGWGTPFLFVVPWTVTKTLYENQGCWFNNSTWIWWIIRGPITLSVAIVFYIFIKIMTLLLSKLKADQMKFTDYRYSLARATLVLIPLLGIHEVVFTFIFDEYVDGRTRYVRNFINLTISSFQGLFVAILYCFANGEVQAELKKRWQLFIFANHFDVQDCFQKTQFKYLWKCSRRQPARGSGQSEPCGESSVPCNVQLLQVTIRSRGEFQRGRPTGIEFYARGSLSSSEGEMTLGETLEEILEESEF